MSLFSGLPSAIGAKAFAGLAVVGIAGLGGTATLVSSHSSSPSTHLSLQSPKPTSNPLDEASATPPPVAPETSPSPETSPEPSPSTANHGDAVSDQVKACQAARPTSGPQGIGACVAPVARGNPSATRSPEPDEDGATENEQSDQDAAEDAGQKGQNGPNAQHSDERGSAATPAATSAGGSGGRGHDGGGEH